MMTDEDARAIALAHAVKRGEPPGMFDAGDQRSTTDVLAEAIEFLRFLAPSAQAPRIREDGKLSYSARDIIETGLDVMAAAAAPIKGEAWPTGAKKKPARKPRHRRK